MSEEHSLLSIRNRVGNGEGGVKIPVSSLCVISKAERGMIHIEKTKKSL